MSFMPNVVMDLVVMEIFKLLKNLENIEAQRYRY